tara:strand:- start:650 stop:2251 length:1602 start_codon:yes stop_codon:yes gene_type:complete
MCILCKNKKTNIPTIDIKKSIQTDVDRSGLSNIFNLENSVNFCNEEFKQPLYYMDGTVKATTGYTTTACSGITTGTTYSVSGCSAVYNLSEIEDFDLTFNITGNTEYSGYTGSFCYHIFDLDLLNKNTDFITQNDSILTDCFVFSAITGNTIVDKIVQGDLPVKDAQYFLKDYSIFKTKECPTNLSINTFNLSTYPKEDLYSDGWYFITVTNPEKPILFTNNSGGLIKDTVLNTELVPIRAGQTTFFKINGIPLNNKMLVYLNGIQLTEGADWISSIDNVGLIELVNGTLEPGRDQLSVTYLDLQEDTKDIFNLNEDYLEMDAFIVSGITTDVTYSGASRPSINYNTVKSRQELLTTQPIKNSSKIIFTINGVTLTENIEFFTSNSDNTKLIMEPNTVIKEGDAVSVFYLTDTPSGYLDVGVYRTLTPTVNWYVPESYEQYLPKNGEFLIQVTTEEDENFDNPIQQIFVDLIKGEPFYSKELEELPTTVGNNFLFKVYFFKNYPILFGNNVKTRNVSETGFFQVNMNYSKNSY